MRQGLFVILPIAVMLVSCGKPVERSPEASPGGTALAEAVPGVSLVEIMVGADEFVGQTVGVTGTVEHVCRHGGKKMFIVGDNPGDRLRITSGDNISAFEVDLEGSDVVVQGVVMEEKIDDAFLDAWEADLKNPGTDGGAGKGAEAGEHHDDIPTQIATFRMIIADNDGEPISFYHLECNAFEELD